MTQTSSDKEFYKSFLLQAVIVVVFVFLASFVALTYQLHNQTKDRLAALDQTTKLIAQQIKTANINSLLEYKKDHLIFIVRKTDGAYIFESQQRTGKAKEQWEFFKTLIGGELKRNETGELNYPDRQPWQIFSSQRRIRYSFLPDLDWIVAVEVPTTPQLYELKEIYTLEFIGILLGFSAIAVALCFFLLNRVANVNIRVDVPKESVAKTPNKPKEVASKPVLPKPLSSVM